MTCLQTVSLGAYVLGALDVPERLRTEAHLRDCAPCRDELVRLAPLPGLLGQVSLDDVVTPDDPVRPDVPPAATGPARPAVPRRWTGLLVGAAAVLVLLVGIGVAGVVVVDDPPADDPVVATWSTGEGADAIDATAVLADRGWGTDIRLTMEELPAHERCRLVVIAADGRVETAGWWTTGYAADAVVPASTSIDVAAIERMEVRAGDRVLAVLRPV
jgi:Putative zinc-finger